MILLILFPGWGISSDNNARQDIKIVKIWLIGDSTLTDYSKENNYKVKKYPKTGWGQVFQQFVSGKNLEALKEWFNADSVIVENHAVGGRSTRSFFQEGRWRKVYDELEAGDFVFIQFGHNDASVKKTERYVDTEGYKEFLRLYVAQTREKGASPVLITPVARNYPWEGEVLKNVHGEYPAGMKAIAAETNTSLIDLNELSMRFFSEKGREYVSKYYFMNLPEGKYEAYPEGLDDNTHFQPEGANEVARLVYKGLKDLAMQSPGQSKKVSAYDLVVDQNGNGDFKTVQEAISSVPDFRKNRTTIYIRNGIYKEKLILPASKTNITMLGENLDSVILTHDDFASKKNSFGEEMGTTGSTSFYIFGDGFRAENITFENSSGPVGQAVAVRIDGDMVAFNNCRFLGFQDTLYPHGEHSKQYYKNCYIEGSVDFIFGWSRAVFENCTIFCKSKGYITAPSTDQDNEYGFVFLNCRITGSAPEGSVYLGRPWRPYGRSVFIHCELDKLIKSEGWHNWRKVENETTAYFAEYENHGPGAISDNRVKWSHQLSANEAEIYTIGNILGDWALNPGLFNRSE